LSVLAPLARQAAERGYQLGPCLTEPLTPLSASVPHRDLPPVDVTQ
jgi:hypothetical protein